MTERLTDILLHIRKDRQAFDGVTLADVYADAGHKALRVVLLLMTHSRDDLLRGALLCMVQTEEAHPPGKAQAAAAASAFFGFIERELCQ